VRKGEVGRGEGLKGEGERREGEGEGEVERKELVKGEWERVRRMSLEIRQEASSVQRDLEHQEPLRLRAFKVRVVGVRMWLRHTSVEYMYVYYVV
jgi:hypothetical protein